MIDYISVDEKLRMDLLDANAVSELMQKKSKRQTPEVIWRYAKLKGRWHSKEMMTRQTMWRERTVSYSQMEDVGLLLERNYVV